MQAGYGILPYGYGPYGLGSVASPFTVLSPLAGASGVARRPLFVVNISSSFFDPSTLYLVAGGVTLVTAGVAAEGWEVRVFAGASIFQVVVTVKDYKTAAYLPASTLVSATFTSGGDTITWSFTTVESFTFTKIEAVADSLVKVWFNRPPADNSITRDPSSYSFTPKGGALPTKARAVRYTSGDLFVLLPLASSIQKTGLYTFKTDLTDVNGESVE